jgi:hypothetical protein
MKWYPDTMTSLGSRTITRPGDHGMNVVEFGLSPISDLHGDLEQPSRAALEANAGKDVIARGLVVGEIRIPCASAKRPEHYSRPYARELEGFCQWYAYSNQWNMGAEAHDADEALTQRAIGPFIRRKSIRSRERYQSLP